MNLDPGCLTAESSLICQSLIFLIRKIKSDCSFCRDEIYRRYIKYPTRSRHSANASSSFLFRGILSVSWSQADAELLLSSAKDNQVLCWHLGSSEVGWRSCGHAGWEMRWGGNPATPVCSGMVYLRQGFPNGVFSRIRWCISYPHRAAGALMCSGALGTLQYSLLPPLTAGSVCTL